MKISLDEINSKLDSTDHVKMDKFEAAAIESIQMTCETISSSII